MGAREFESALEARLPDLLRRYDRPVPRYTSFPTADRFDNSFGPTSYARALAVAAESPDDPLSLYIHLPFCPQLCTYCGCTVVVSSNADRKSAYLDAVLLEIERVSALLGHRRGVREIHLGGGTPNTFSPEELARLMAHIEEHFEILPDAEVSIEVDPRRGSRDQIFELRDIGFRRLSMGVQDFEAPVQEAVGRVQTFEETETIMRAARDAGFTSVNIDLIYGLPMQTRASFARTIRRTLELNPDRVALFSFAYVPTVRPNQKKISPTSLPLADAKLDLFLGARRQLRDAAYVDIGMDHFARPDDPIAKAHVDGTLHRNFQGYTVLKGADTIGFGMSAIGEVGGAYAANPRRVDAYLAAIEAGGLATERGVELTKKDKMARDAIRDIMCAMRLSEDTLASRYGMRLDEAFPGFRARLAPLVDEGFVTVNDDHGCVIEVTPLGRLFVRHAAAAFDHHLVDGAAVPYSRAV